MIKKKRWHCLPGQPLTELDKQVMFWENKGKLVPTRDLIKTPEQIEGIRKSGVVNTGCLDAVAEMIRPGINTQEIDDLCMQYCKDHNAIPACLNYEGYPKSVCTSINEVVCHGIPKEEDVLEEGDIINIDIPNAKITLEVSDEVLAERKAKYVAPEPNIKTGWLSRYARMVTSANLGAVLK